MVMDLTIIDVVHREMMTDWSDVQCFGIPVLSTEPTITKGICPPVRDSSPGVGDHLLSDWDTPGLAHSFSEGRRLLLGM